MSIPPPPPKPMHEYTHAHTHIPSYICPLLRSYKDKEGIRAMGKQAQRNRVETRDVLRCQTEEHEGTEVMVGRRVENDEQKG